MVTSDDEVENHKSVSKKGEEKEEEVPDLDLNFGPVIADAPATEGSNIIISEFSDDCDAKSTGDINDLFDDSVVATAALPSITKHSNDDDKCDDDDDDFGSFEATKLQPSVILTVDDTTTIVQNTHDDDPPIIEKVDKSIEGVEEKTVEDLDGFGSFDDVKLVTDDMKKDDDKNITTVDIDKKEKEVKKDDDKESSSDDWGFESASTKHDDDGGWAVFSSAAPEAKSTIATTLAPPPPSSSNDDIDDDDDDFGDFDCAQATSASQGVDVNQPDESEDISSLAHSSVDNLEVVLKRVFPSFLVVDENGNNRIKYDPTDDALLQSASDINSISFTWSQCRWSTLQACRRLLTSLQIDHNNVDLSILDAYDQRSSDSSPSSPYHDRALGLSCGDDIEAESTRLGTDGATAAATASGAGGNTSQHLSDDAKRLLDQLPNLNFMRSKILVSYAAS